jgi:hypothetical protein
MFLKRAWAGGRENRVQLLVSQQHGVATHEQNVRLVVQCNR